jgi:hypothetical protein
VLQVEDHGVVFQDQVDEDVTVVDSVLDDPVPEVVVDSVLGDLVVEVEVDSGWIISQRGASSV